MTAAAILDAAEEVFAAHGLQAARMEDIAARAGVAVGTLYNYFDDRQKLLLALFERRHAQLLERLDARLADDAGAPFVRRVEGALSALLEHFDQHRSFFKTLSQGELVGALSGDACKAQATMLDVRARFESLLDEGVARGVLRAEDMVVYPAALLGMVRGTMIQAVRDDDVAPTSQRAAALVRVFLHGASAGAERPDARDEGGGA